MHKPEVLTVLDHEVIVRRAPDDSLRMIYLQGHPGGQSIATRRSPDNGRSWSAPLPLVELPTDRGTFLGCQMVFDQRGELHLFSLNDGGGGVDDVGEGERALHNEITDKRLDIWHAYSSHGLRTWSPPRPIWKGFTGAMNSVILSKNGRLVYPFSYMTSRTWRNRGAGLDAFTFMGKYDCTALFSDDDGRSWKLANSINVTVPDTVYAYGAVEPVILQLKDGRLWMLVRTQLGRFWESFSDDGSCWSRPQPTAIVSSDSPAGLVRLDDGRIVLLWNNCQRFPYAYGGRHVIHAAISSDEGQTWHGCREVARDPRRNEPPPLSGDYGTAYPLPVATREGKVIYSTGQGAGRIMLMSLDPEWLMATSHKADFTSASDEWAVFGTKGVQFVDHPERAGEKALRIGKVAEDWPAVAVWNFPAGPNGRLTLRFRLTPGHAAIGVGLADHFSPPFDLEDRFHNLATISIASDSRLLGAVLEAGRSYALKLNWSCREGCCGVALDGRSLGMVPLRHESCGASYLRLGSPAGKPAAGALLVEGVEVEIADFLQ